MKHAEETAYSVLVDAIYDAALSPENYLKFAKVWDDHIVGPMLAANDLDAKNGVDLEMLKAHFERALKVFERTKLKTEDLVQSFLDNQKFAAGIARLDGSLIAGNAAFSDRFGLQIGQSFYDHAQKLMPPSASRKRPEQAIWDDPAQPVTAALYLLPDGKEAVIIVEQLDQHEFDDVDSDAVLLIKSCHAEWAMRGAGILEQSFGFTEAEMEIAQALYTGQKSSEIAADRDRSLGTVQKQIKSLLSKAQVSSQSEFISLVIGLMHVIDVAPKYERGGVELDHQQGSFKHIAVKNMRRDRMLQFAHYGATDGDAVLFLHAHTSSAIPTQAMVKAAAANNLQIIAPCKPGVGQTTPDDGTFEPMAFIGECLHLLDHLQIDRVALAGHAMSGVYAIHAAERYPGRFCAVGLLDTGTPMTTQQHFEDMPEDSRRIFLAAKNTPDLLYAPFAFAAASANRDEAGHRAFMKSQFAQSANSTELLKLPHIYQPASKAMSDYMSQPRRSVDELIYWVSDWTQAFQKVAAKMPVAFIQSELHEWLMPGRTADFCKAVPGASYTAIEGCSELFVFDRPEAFCSALSGLCKSDGALPD